MERRRKRVKVGNEEVDCDQVTFQPAGENWNEYLASDGTVLRLKLVVTEVLRMIDRYDAEGNPMYVVRSSNVMVVSPPDNLRKENA